MYNKSKNYIIITNKNYKINKLNKNHNYRYNESNIKINP